jgi:hypothetical protein
MGKVGAWIVNVGAPALITQLSTWGRQLVAWIGPMIPPALAALGDMLGKVGAWMIKTGIPTLAAKAGELGRAAVGAIMDFLVGSHGETGLMQLMADWFLNKFLPALPALGVQMASGLIGFAGDIGRNIIGGLGDALAGIGKAIFDALVAGLNWALAQQITVGPITLGLGRATINLPFGNFTVPFLAEGIRNFTGGVAVVGEKGPELVNLPRGTNVTPNAQLGKGGNTFIYQITNPKPETASTSVFMANLRQAALGHAGAS